MKKRHYEALELVYSRLAYVKDSEQYLIKGGHPEVCLSRLAWFCSQGPCLSSPLCHLHVGYISILIHFQESKSPS